MEKKIIEHIQKTVCSGTTIPKPDTKEDFKVKGWGKRRGEKALVYYIPNHKNPNKPSQKGITESEFETAYQQLIRVGFVSRKWFNVNMQSCAKEGGCNFTTIGGIFELLEIAGYERGFYRLKKQQ